MGRGRGHGRPGAAARGSRRPALPLQRRGQAAAVSIAIGTLPSGPVDAITDVDGIRVGSVTLIEREDVRTGVTVVIAHDGREPLFAGSHTLNGNGELTGLEWIRDWGCLSTPIGLTNTHSVGVVRDAIVAADVAGRGPGGGGWGPPGGGGARGGGGHERNR